MPTLSNPRMSIAGNSRIAGPPPIQHHGRGPSAAFLDETADDVRRLTAEIDRVLTGRPAASRPAAGSLSQALGGARTEVESWIEGSEAFSWQEAAELRTPGAVADQAAGWLGRAKRERRFARLRAVVSWTVALGFAAAISGAAAYVVHGGLPDAAAVDRALRALGL